MKNKLTCLTLWAALAATYVQADTVAKPSSEKNWSASISLDGTANIMTVTHKIRSAAVHKNWSNTNSTQRRVLPGATVQATYNVHPKYYVGLEGSLRLGDIKSTETQYQITTNQREITHLRRMSQLLNAGLLFGYKFTDMDINIKLGVSSARVRHASLFKVNRIGTLHYKKNVSGYYLGVGASKHVFKNFYIGLDYEHAMYHNENKDFYYSDGFPITHGFYKGNAKIDTLKLRLIYKI